MIEQNIVSGLVSAACLAYSVRSLIRRRKPPHPPTREPSLDAYLAADVTAGLPHEDMVRAAIVEYMHDERSNVVARIAKLESELDFYILNKGEGAVAADPYPEMKSYGMVGPPREAGVHDWRNAKPVCRCENPVVLEIMGRADRYCGLCGGEPPQARWYPADSPTCQVCDGSGLYTLEEPTCPACGGTGNRRPAPRDTGQPETR